MRNNKNGLYPIYGGNGISGYYNEYNIDKPTIVIGRVGFYCGSIHYVKSNAWVTDNAFIASTYGKVYDINFLYYLLVYCNLRQYSNSTAQPVISGKTIYPVYVPIPPINEQKRIVAEIENLLSHTKQLELSQDRISSVIKQAKSKILDLAIHGKLVPQNPSDEPAKELLKRINPKAEITCDTPRYGKLPKGWCICNLKDLCVFLSRGKSPKYLDQDKRFPVFAQKCNLKEGGISLEQARFLDPSTIDKWSEVYKLKTGDILVNSTGTGTVGRTRLFNEKCLGKYPFVVPDSHVSVIRTFDDISSEYVYAYMSSDTMQGYFFDNLAGSTNQKELYIGILENMLVSLPPIQEQHRIVAKIEELFAQLDKIEASL